MTAQFDRTIPPGEVQLCPKCRIPMSVTDVIPTMPTTGLDEDELVYRPSESSLVTARYPLKILTIASRRQER
jgi:hypothetical protein